MRILVTGGAGFIGSHTCDRLLSLGHQVVVLDALVPPVHRGGWPSYMSPEVDLYQGDVRNRDLLANMLRRVDAVYHFAAYQDYLTDFARFTDVNVTSTALIYEIAVAERLNLSRVVVASSQAAMGEGLYLCPNDGEVLPGMRPEAALRARQWDIACPHCGGALQMQPTPERVSAPQNAYGMSKLGEEMVAVNLGRRYGIPTVALRYSIVQGPRQSVYNAYSGACRIFCLHYMQGTAPVLYEDGQSVRDYVNIDDVVDANVLVLEDEVAAGRVFNVGGAAAVTTRQFSDIVMRQYGSDQPGSLTGEYRFGDTRHILSDIGALQSLGWKPQRTPATSVAAYAAWLEGIADLDGVLADANERMRALGVVRRAAQGTSVIITQTPLRIGLVGGGTDLPDYYREHGGRVLNCAIDKYVFVIVKQRFDDDIYVNYSKKEIVSRVEDLEHELVREAMYMTGVCSGVEVTMLADIPSAGSGLGSSSSVTVGLLHALWSYQGHHASARELAEGACTIEIERCGKRIGRQDQYIAALGGIRDIHFELGDRVRAEEIQLAPADRRALEAQLMLFYTGVTRSATAILTEQSDNVSTSRAGFDTLRDLAAAAADRLRSGDVQALGEALRQSWEVKRKLASGISNDHIDGAVELALNAGACGAKVTGAGGGGFLLVICPPENQRAVRQALAHMKELPVKLDRYGSRVVFNVMRDIWG